MIGKRNRQTDRQTEITTLYLKLLQFDKTFILVFKYKLVSKFLMGYYKYIYLKI